MGVCCTEDAESTGGSADEDGLADATGVPAALDERVGDPAAAKSVAVAKSQGTPV